MTWDTLHDEDVVYEFRGNRPEQLTSGRFYRGTVDGFADFGVFVTIGESVTGLLHRSQLDRRLESLDWDVGETVYVQVTNVRDNGNVDLAWSIRQSDAEFRGTRVDDPNAEQREPPDDSTESSDSRADATTADTGESTSAGDDETPTRAGATASASTADESTDSPADESTASDVGAGDVATDAPFAGGSVPKKRPLERRTIDSLPDRVGEMVRLEGEITGIRQTGGPTIFTVRDETETVDCAAFEQAGVRAYPAIDVGDVVRLEGQVERHRDEIQLETDSLSTLGDADRAVVAERLEEAITARARPDDQPLLADHQPVEAVLDSIRAAATAIRRAALQDRPIVVRHTATVDGYVAGAALERALVSLIEVEHDERDAVYHYVERRPLTEAYYDMDAATSDVSSLLEDRARHGAKRPLVVVVGAGSGAESAAALELLSIYDAGRVIIDVGPVDEVVADAVDVIVNPSSASGRDGVTSTALAANVAAHVSADVRADLVHLPAISYWTDVPPVYATLASEAGFDEETVRERREAIALEAYYQRFDEKRELVADLLFDGQGAGELAAHVSEQFRSKLSSAVETALSNVERREVDGVPMAILDTDAAVHRFDFPPRSLLLDALHEETSTDGDRHVTIGLALDSLDVRGPSTIDLRSLAATVREQVPDAGISVTGGRLRFLVGTRHEVLEATVDAIGEQLE